MHLKYAEYNLLMSYICTICGDKNVEFGKVHQHNPNGKPVDVIKLYILKFAPSLWEED
jgi:hypothetical protein